MHHFVVHHKDDVNQLLENKVDEIYYSLLNFRPP